MRLYQSLFLSLIVVKVVYGETRLVDPGVYGWGKANGGSLASDSKSIVQFPTFIDALKDFEVVQVSASDSSSFILNDKGQVYSFGTGGNYGNLGDGRSKPHTVSNPFLISQLKDVVQISIGVSHGLALTSKGKVFSWGNGNRGKLGLGLGLDHAVTKPEETLLDNIVQVAAGELHSLFLTNEGEVYGAGDNTANQLGVGPPNLSTFPSKIDIKPVTKMVQIAAGKTFSLAVEEGGRKLWGWGNLSFIHTEKLTSRPVHLVAFNDLIDKVSKAKIKQVRAWDSIMVLLEDGTLISAGDDSNGKLCLGINSPDVWRVPPTVSPLNNVSSMSIGPYHSILITENAQVYTCGLASEGRLGDGTTTSYISKPELIASFTLINESLARAPAMASAGTSHSLLVTLSPLAEFVKMDQCPFVHPAKCPFSKLCTVSANRCVPEYHQCDKNPLNPFHCAALSTTNKCVQSPQMCVGKVQCQNGTFSCWNGQCVGDVSECSLVPSCPYDTPKRCRLECASRETICKESECPEGNKLCPSGYCVRNDLPCNEYKGCPVGFFSCDNGTCVTSPEECQRCDPKNDLYSLCFDGSCSPLCPKPPSFEKPIKTTLTLSKYSTKATEIYSEDGEPLCSFLFGGYSTEETRVQFSPVSDERIASIPNQDYYDSITKRMVSMAVTIKPESNGPKKLESFSCRVTLFSSKTSTTACLAFMSSDNKVSCVSSVDPTRNGDKVTMTSSSEVDLKEGTYFFLFGEIQQSSSKKKSIGVAFAAIALVIMVSVIILTLYKRKNQNPEEKEKFLNDRDEENPRTDIQLEDMKDKD